MNWKLKAIIQNLVEKLPPNLSYALYYYMQRKFGGLQRMNPLNDLQKSVEIVEMIKKCN